VYLSDVVATAMQVPGVQWVDTEADAAVTAERYGDPSRVNRFKRWGQAQGNEFQEGRIDIGRLEIARLDNDPNARENGKIEFHMEGGL
jgi:hypothetical protein